MSSVDKLHLEKFKKAINYTGEVKSYTKKSGYKDSTECSVIIISSNKLAEDLIKDGCIEHKTKILVYPDKNIVPKELERHFIRGLIDGDGALSINKN